MKSKLMLDSFTVYCAGHPEERFWQALRNWARQEISADINFVLVAGYGWLMGNEQGDDTFYWEDDKLKDYGSTNS